MSFSSFLSKLKYGSYEASKKASVYEEIAVNFGVPPQHVYEIAHGKRKLTPLDDNIYYELLDKGIVVMNR